jgi:hypothetical protein
MIHKRSEVVNNNNNNNNNNKLGADKIREVLGCVSFQIPENNCLTMVYLKLSGLTSWSENYKRYSSLPLGAVV